MNQLDQGEPIEVVEDFEDYEESNQDEEFQQYSRKQEQYYQSNYGQYQSQQEYDGDYQEEEEDQIQNVPQQYIQEDPSKYETESQNQQNEPKEFYVSLKGKSKSQVPNKQRLHYSPVAEQNEQEEESQPSRVQTNHASQTKPRAHQAYGQHFGPTFNNKDELMIALQDEIVRNEEMRVQLRQMRQLTEAVAQENDELVQIVQTQQIQLNSAPKLKNSESVKVGDFLKSNKKSAQGERDAEDHLQLQQKQEQCELLTKENKKKDLEIKELRQISKDLQGEIKQVTFYLKEAQEVDEFNSALLTENEELKQELAQMQQALQKQDTNTNNKEGLPNDSSEQVKQWIIKDELNLQKIQDLEERNNYLKQEIEEQKHKFEIAEQQKQNKSNNSQINSNSKDNQEQLETKIRLENEIDQMYEQVKNLEQEKQAMSDQMGTLVQEVEKSHELIQGLKEELNLLQESANQDDQQIEPPAQRHDTSYKGEASLSLQTVQKISNQIQLNQFKLEQVCQYLPNPASMQLQQLTAFSDGNQNQQQTQIVELLQSQETFIQESILDQIKSLRNGTTELKEEISQLQRKLGESQLENQDISLNFEQLVEDNNQLRIQLENIQDDYQLQQTEYGNIKQQFQLYKEQYNQRMIDTLKSTGQMAQQKHKLQQEVIDLFSSKLLSELDKQSLRDYLKSDELIIEQNHECQNSDLTQTLLQKTQMQIRELTKGKIALEEKVHAAVLRIKSELALVDELKAKVEQNQTGRSMRASVHNNSVMSDSVRVSQSQHQQPFYQPINIGRPQSPVVQANSQQNQVTKKPMNQFQLQSQQNSKMQQQQQQYQGSMDYQSYGNFSNLPQHASQPVIMQSQKGRPQTPTKLQQQLDDHEKSFSQIKQNFNQFSVNRK